MRNNVTVSCFLTRNLGFLFFFLFLPFGSLMKHEPKFSISRYMFWPSSLEADFISNGSSTNRWSSWSPVSSTMMYIHPKPFILSIECFTTCHRLFSNIFEYSPEFFTTFARIFGDIPRNIWRHSPECLVTFPQMFEDIPRNVWQHSLEYNISPIPHVPRIPFPVPVFLVLYIALNEI